MKSTDPDLAGNRIGSENNPALSTYPTGRSLFSKLEMTTPSPTPSMMIIGMLIKANMKLFFHTLRLYSCTVTRINFFI